MSSAFISTNWRAPLGPVCGLAGVGLTSPAGAGADDAGADAAAGADVSGRCSAL